MLSGEIAHRNIHYYLIGLHQPVYVCGFIGEETFFSYFAYKIVVEMERKGHISARFKWSRF